MRGVQQAGQGGNRDEAHICVSAQYFATIAWLLSVISFSLTSYTQAAVGCVPQHASGSVRPGGIHKSLELINKIHMSPYITRYYLGPCAALSAYRHIDAYPVWCDTAARLSVVLAQRPAGGHYDHQFRVVFTPSLDPRSVVASKSIGRGRMFSHKSRLSDLKNDTRSGRMPDVDRIVMEAVSGDIIKHGGIVLGFEFV